MQALALDLLVYIGFEELTGFGVSISGFGLGSSVP